MSKIKIGIAGCSRRIRSVIDHFMLQNPKVAFAAFFDEDLQYAKEMHGYIGSGQVYQAYDEMINDTELDWVFIASRNCDHANQIIKALNSNINIFVEKPIAISFEDCLSILSTSQQSKSKFMIGFTLRFSPHYKKIKEILDSGEIGEIISFEFNENITPYHGSHIMANWRRFRKYTGFHLLEKCCHDIDIANWLTGSRVKMVASFGGNNFFKEENSYLIQDQKIVNNQQLYIRYGQNSFETEKDIVDNQVCIMEYENGIRSMFHTNLNAAIPERRMVIIGSKGTLRTDVINGTFEIAKTGLDENIHSVKMDVKGGHGGGDEILAKELYQYMLDEIRPSTTILNGIESAFVCFGLDQAQRSQSVVQMDSYWTALDEIV